MKMGSTAKASTFEHPSSRARSRKVSKAAKEISDEIPAVPALDWGKDHWSLLAYIETRCVDYKGTIDHRHLRCNPLRHLGLALVQHEGGCNEKGYRFPTRLRQGLAPVPGHDDWDCFYDIEKAGFIMDIGTGINPAAEMTDAGLAAVAKLRAWLAGGGKTSAFQLKE